MKPIASPIAASHTKRSVTSKKCPSAEVEGHELTTTYYIDGAVATQAQNGVRPRIQARPRRPHHRNHHQRQKSHESLRRSRRSRPPGPAKKKAKKLRVTSRVSTEAYPPCGPNNETPEVQLHDLQGDVVATIGDSNSETKLNKPTTPPSSGHPTTAKHHPSTHGSVPVTSRTNSPPASSPTAPPPTSHRTPAPSKTNKSYPLGYPRAPPSAPRHLRGATLGDRRPEPSRRGSARTRSRTRTRSS